MRLMPESAVWTDDANGAAIRFAGKAVAAGGLERSARSLAADASETSRLDISWLEQVHGHAVRRARPGFSGRGDALWTPDPNTALVIVTADCVPVLIAGTITTAAVHAGWRGVVAGVVPAACARLVVVDSAVAWIGPSIGACCYEVGDDVAREIADASAESVVSSAASGKPRVDLQAAVRIQLQRAGVGEIRTVDQCTHCHPEDLWSYRRSGPRAGRNLALIWR